MLAQTLFMENAKFSFVVRQKRKVTLPPSAAHFPVRWLHLEFQVESPQVPAPPHPCGGPAPSP